MLFRDLWNYLQTVHEAIHTGDLKKQDKAINALFRFFRRHNDQRFPALLYGQAIRLLCWYPEHVLPTLNAYAPEDCQAIAENYRTLVKQLEEAAVLSQQIERAFEQLLDGVKNRTFTSIHEIADVLSEIARNFFDPPELKGCVIHARRCNPFVVSLSNHDINPSTSSGRTVGPMLAHLSLTSTHDLHILKGFQKPLATLQENFRYDQAAKFFQGFLAALLGDSIASATSSHYLPRYNFKIVFEYLLESYFQAKSVVVDSFKHGFIMPLWVSMEYGKTSARVEFWNQDIDVSMQASADTARRIARQYLLEEYGKHVPENLVVHCCFPRDDVSFKDTSASLLIGISIVGEVLGIKSKPGTVITGEVGESGEILRVGFINEKIEAASKHEGIERMIIPEANVPEISSPPLVGGVRGGGSDPFLPPPNLPHQGGGTTSPPNLPHQGGGTTPPPNLPHQGGGMTVIPVRTFDEAVQQVLDLHWEDWGEAPGLDVFYGRQEELEDVRRWILDEQCRLAAILGMGGIGKTSLTKKFCEQIKNRFHYVFWRDLRNAPAAKDVFGDCIKFLSHQQQIDLPEETHQQISLLFKYLKKYRCLLILDNLETILHGGNGGGHSGSFLEEYEDYNMLIQQVGRTEHQSCLIFTSREKPPELEILKGKPVRFLQLDGLEPREAEAFLKNLEGAKEERDLLITHYAGHPLALKLAVATIRDVFHRNIAMFFHMDTPLFNDIEALLTQHFARLSKREQEVMFWLAIEREAVPLLELQGDIVSPVLKKELPNIINSLFRKSLIERTPTGFTLQPVVMEYTTTRLIHDVCEELFTGTISLFNSHALMKAQTKDYIRESQKRLILKPIADHLAYEYELDREEIAARLKKILAKLQEQRPPKPGYAAGNILNFLLYLECHLSGYDFSNLPVWQAYLQGAELHDVNFTRADLRGSVFTDTFGNILAVAYSPFDNAFSPERSRRVRANGGGRYLAAGTLSKEVRIWSTEDYRLFQNCTGHTGWVWSVTFSPDGKILASGSQDQTVKLWEIATGQCLKTLDEHTASVWSVAFSYEGDLLASGSDDGVKIWDVQTGQSLLTLQDSTQGIHAVTFSPDGKILATGRADRTVQLWDVPTQEPLMVENITSLRLQKTLSGHTDRVRAIAFNPDGTILVSGGDDQTLRVWDVSSGHCLNTLYGHTALVRSVAFSLPSPDRRGVGGEVRLASSSDDYTIRVWDVLNWQCLKILQTEGWVLSVSFKPHEHLLASGAGDQTIRVWDTDSGQCITTIEGYTNRTLAVAWSPDGSQFVSGHSDTTIRFWEVHSYTSQWRCDKTVHGHVNWVMSVAFSPDGQRLATGSSDKSVRIWDTETGRCLKILQKSQKQEGHSKMVRAVVFSSDGKTLLTCSDDKTIRLWDLSTSQCAAIFRESDWIYSAVLSPDDTFVATGSQDHCVRVWNITTEECVHIFEGHTQPVRSVAFSPNGSLLASGSDDQTVRLWDAGTGECVTVFNEHTKPVRSVAFSPDGRLLASGSEDQTVRVWDLNTGGCLTVLNCFDKQDNEGNWVRAVAFSPDSHRLVSGGENGTIRLWDVQTGECLDTMQPDRPYERMNITGVTGINEAQKSTLKALGAIEDSAK